MSLVWTEGTDSIDFEAPDQTRKPLESDLSGIKGSDSLILHGEAIESSGGNQWNQGV